MPDMPIEPTSNVRRFETGSVRDTVEGKPRFDLNSPISDHAIAMVNNYGQGKYAPRNWELGQPLLEGPAASLERHLNAWKRGEELDPASGLPHLWHVHWNSMALVHLAYEIQAGHLPDTLDDRPLVRDERHRGPRGLTCEEKAALAPTCEEGARIHAGCMKHVRKLETGETQEQNDRRAAFGLKSIGTPPEPPAAQTATPASGSEDPKVGDPCFDTECYRNGGRCAWAAGSAGMFKHCYPR